jgi:hypothetical protein
LALEVPSLVAIRVRLLDRLRNLGGLAWHRLAPEQKIRATVKAIGGPAYTAKEIERLYYGTDAGVMPRCETPSGGSYGPASPLSCFYDLFDRLNGLLKAGKQI